MSDKFIVEIISPDQTILKQETNEVIIPSFEGQMGILNNHIPLITFLRPGIITIKNQEDPKLGNYNIYFEDYELANGIMTPKKITTKLYDGTIVVYEFTDIQINLGISDFFFKAISL